MVLIGVGGSLDGADTWIVFLRFSRDVTEMILVEGQNGLFTEN